RNKPPGMQGQKSRMSSNEQYIAAEIKRASEAMNMGAMAVADVICRKILDSHPGHPLALNFAGVLAGQIGLFDLAEYSFAEAVKKNPHFVPAKANLDRLMEARTRQAAEAELSWIGLGQQHYLLIKSWGSGFWSDVSHILSALLLA